MLKSLVLCLLPLAACASNNVKDEQFYHSLNLKPTITEVATDNARFVCLYNPFPKTLNIPVDCESEENIRIVEVSPNAATCFTIKVQDDVSMVCSIEHGWTLK